ncbi:DUF3750 domain-containing protein [Beggiatoa alba]|nr:DUF3750 domain-containing protein [Beggiatoa alba]
MVLIFGNLSSNNENWQAFQDQRAKLAPPPSTEQAIIQVYAARSFGWQGAFSVHTWIACKRQAEKQYKLYQVVGWYKQMNTSVLSMQLLPENDTPDVYWYGQAPQRLVDVRGAGEIDALIDRLDQVVISYPYKNHYRAWFGPNSNTFTAYVARALPELRLDLPSTAMGKDYLSDGTFFAIAPSGTGGQVSLFGIVSATLATEEGLELNLLGLHFGLDLLDITIRFPGIGRIGF